MTFKESDRLLGIVTTNSLILKTGGKVAIK
jgi:hypothetical protein